MSWHIEWMSIIIQPPDDPFSLYPIYSQPFRYFDFIISYFRLLCAHEYRLRQNWWMDVSIDTESLLLKENPPPPLLTHLPCYCNNKNRNIIKHRLFYYSISLLCTYHIQEIHPSYMSIDRLLIDIKRYTNKTIVVSLQRIAKPINLYPQ
jgi:hypothetical protein